MDMNEFWFWFNGTLRVILIDLVLSGDNALIIGMAAGNLSGEMRKRAIIWGTVGAIALRVAMTVLILKFLYSNVPFLQLFGGLLLFWITYKLLVLEEKKHEEVKPGKNFWEAIKIIVVADITLSLDNMLAVAGSVGGHLILVIVGLILSIPILMIGAAVVASVISRFSWLVGLGAALIAYIGAEMVLKDPVLKAISWITHDIHTYAPWVIGVGVLLYSFWLLRRREAADAAKSDKKA